MTSYFHNLFYFFEILLTLASYSCSRVWFFIKTWYYSRS